MGMSMRKTKRKKSMLLGNELSTQLSQCPGASLSNDCLRRFNYYPFIALVNRVANGRDRQGFVLLTREAVAALTATVMHGPFV